MSIPKKAEVNVTVSIDVSHLAKEMLALTVGAYPNGGYKSNTVLVSRLEEHVKYNMLYRPGRALFVKYPHGEVICMNRGGCSHEVIEKAVKDIQNMQIGAEDSAPYH